MSADNTPATTPTGQSHQVLGYDEKPGKMVDQGISSLKAGPMAATSNIAPHTPVTHTITGSMYFQNVHPQQHFVSVPAPAPAYASQVMHQQTGFAAPQYSATSYQSTGYQPVSHYQNTASHAYASQYHMTGAGSTISQQHRIISERVIEHEVKVPKKVVREDVVEKVIVIPEKIVHEEVIEDIQKIREKIIEVAMPVVQERIVEVPEIEYIEKIVEIPEIIYQEKIREVPRIEIQERIVEVPKIIMQEKIVEVPEIEYHDIPVEKIVEVQEVREQIVVKEVPVAQYVEKPVPEYVDVQKEQDVIRSIPIPVEAITTCEFKLPRIRPQYVKVDVPLYVPRFVEVPIPVDVMDNTAIMQSELYAQQVTQLASQSAVSMCEIEGLAGTIKSTNFDSLIGHSDPSQLITQHWLTGKLQIDPISMQYTTTTTHQATAAFASTNEIVVNNAQYHGGVVTRSPAPMSPTAGGLQVAAPLSGTGMQTGPTTSPSAQDDNAEEQHPDSTTVDQPSD